MTVPNTGIKKDSQGGFTLLEILVSLAVMAIVLVSVFRLHSSTLKLADTTRSKSLLPFIVRQQLADVLSHAPAGETVTGEVEENGITYHWTCTAEERSLDDAIALSADQTKSFKALKLIVEGAGRTFQMTTWRYQGEPAD